jgi:hypothetical protein
MSWPTCFGRDQRPIACNSAVESVSRGLLSIRTAPRAIFASRRLLQVRKLKIQISNRRVQNELISSACPTFKHGELDQRFGAAFNGTLTFCKIAATETARDANTCNTVSWTPKSQAYIKVRFLRLYGAILSVYTIRSYPHFIFVAGIKCPGNDVVASARHCAREKKSKKGNAH